MILAEILKDSNYTLSQFNSSEIEELERNVFFKTTKQGTTPYVKCLVRNKDIQLKPEEVIRQLYLIVLTQRYRYPVSRIEVEYTVTFGREKKKADIAIMDKDRPTVPYIIIELKKPKLKDGKEQLKSYCNATGAPMGVWTNGDKISYYHRKDPNYFEEITNIPDAHQTLADILQIKFTLADLEEINQKNIKTLKEIITEMEDEVLANAGVDVFEEVFKLIFTKLYDEWESEQGNQRNTRTLKFKNTGQTDAELRDKIQSLFNQAKEKWEGVFSNDAKINLTPSHLAVCVSYLEKYKLFNSNLDIIDEAFEYLINQSSKGEKGQYFTPRYVIDMCVKMLNPKEHEYLIDTAAGSSGFTVHGMFHVWQQIIQEEGLALSHLLTAANKPPRCTQYVEKRVFAIDFDEKSVRVARTLNLIAGDGETNVLYLNTLDFKRWDERTKEEDWNDTYNDGFKRFKRLRSGEGYKDFNFDVLMANPPFAGDIKEGTMINGYELAKKPDGKMLSKVGRDILFIERNLDFLKPGGRMAIILPQGRFNNSSDKYIRDFIAERCRILAVVGLHGNTFKPHTGTKTSVLLVQKWDDQLCPRVEDYPIFFATMQKSGKDNSGKTIYVKNEDGTLRKDQHGHSIVDHDLFSHEGMTEEGIAEAFIEFAKKEGLSFFDQGLSFDSLKYHELMDRLEAVELRLSEVLEDNDTFRIDSQYFLKDYIQKIHRLQSLACCKIQDFAYVTDGIHESIDFDEDSNVNLISAKSPKENFFDLSGNDYISLEQHLKNPRTELLKNDVIVSTVGTIGNCAVVDETILPANSDRHVGIIRVTKDFKPHFISTFLLSKYGRFQTLRESTGNVQLNLFIYKIRTLTIPRLRDKFQCLIETIVLTSHQKLENSKDLYQQAEELLLSELGLKDWKPTEQNTTIKSFSESFLSSGRLDAEYYQPKYDELEDKLLEFPMVKIKDLIKYPVSSGSTPKAGGDDYTDKEDGIPFIRAVDLKDGRVEIDNFIYVKDYIHNKTLKKTQVKKNDVLFSIAGTVGRCAIFDHEFEANINQAVSILRFDETYIKRLYLIVFFNSEIGKIYISKYSRQGLQTNLNLEEVSNLFIPVMDMDIQTQICQKVELSFELKQQSKRLLEIAKMGVEKAIETDEETAITWINEQLEILGVKL